jgi:hypothetical protein
MLRCAAELALALALGPPPSFWDGDGAGAELVTLADLGLGPAHGIYNMAYIYGLGIMDGWMDGWFRVWGRGI